jgi:hypothetical protein
MNTTPGSGIKLKVNVLSLQFTISKAICYFFKLFSYVDTQLVQHDLPFDAVLLLHPQLNAFPQLAHLFIIFWFL